MTFPSLDPHRFHFCLFIQMSYGRETSGHVVHVIPGTLNLDDAVWATEDDYQVWNQCESNPTTQPANKKPKNSPCTDSSSNRSKSIGKMFFKTKLCCKFRSGTCQYVTNCNFAHSMEELRRPPANWQEIVATQEPREEYQIPSVVSPGFSGENQRLYKGRHCKRFHTDDGCSYGDGCSFLHDEQSRARESVAISLGPGSMGSGAVTYGSLDNNNNGSNLKPSNWKTRICNKWEMTGYCPFENKCHFAHGAGELHRYGGGPVEVEVRDSSVISDSKSLGIASKSQPDNMAIEANYHIGAQNQRPLSVIPRPISRLHQRWKGPDKISKIYGDWIDDVE